MGEAPERELFADMDIPRSVGKHRCIGHPRKDRPFILCYSPRLEVGGGRPGLAMDAICVAIASCDRQCLDNGLDA